MKKAVLVLFFCFSVFSSNYSQTKKESVKELFHVMKQDSMVNKMLDSMMPAMFNQMSGQMKDSTMRAKSKESMTSVMQTMKGLIPQMNEDMILLYDKYFTQNEINDYITFYKSPSGQKFINATPAIMKEFMVTMMQKYMPQMNKVIKEKMQGIHPAEKK